MLRTLNIDLRVPTVHGILIRRHAVDEQARAYFTVKQARVHARNIVKVAEAKASELKKQAMRDGFQAGWIDSINAIFNALQDSEQFYEKIERELKQSVQGALQKTLQQPELALYLIEGWLSAHPNLSENFSVILPKNAASKIDSIRRSLQNKTGLMPDVSVGETGNVVILLNDQGYEFSPERAFVEINELVHQCFQKLEVRKQCVVWREEVMQNWLAGLTQRYGAEGTSAAERGEKLDDMFFGGFDDEFIEDLAE
jgi:vacuolar-type H+-ATPase subunit H